MFASYYKGKIKKGICIKNVMDEYKITQTAVEDYFAALFAATMYCSKAIVIDGDFGLGA
jgi:hypothetical protein